MNKLNMVLKTNEINSAGQGFTLKSAKNANSSSKEEIKPDRISLSESYKGKSSINKKGIISDVRYDLVKKYREILADGSYQIKSNELAEKIVQKVKEGKSRILL